MADQIEDMRLFLAVVSSDGLAAGGRRVGLSPATVSERLARLEARVGARLLTRTTRSIAQTDEGRLYAEAARSILAEVDDIERRLRDGATQLSGPIRVGAPFDLGRNRLARLLDGFMSDHPAITIELVLSDGFGDLVSEGIDFALRYGSLADSSMIARKVASSRRVACAAPAYLRQHGRPARPQDLQDHDCLVMRFGHALDNRWRFRHDGHEMTVTVTGRRAANDGDLIRRWAIDGHGVALKSVWDIEEDIAAGRLIALLDDFAPPSTSLQIVYSAGREPPRRCRALMEHITRHFASLPESVRE